MRVKNPVLRGFNPDPCILQVAGKFYIATSTFEWFPGVNIYESDDLCNWKLVARPLTDTKLLFMYGNESSSGVWAPCLSYNERRREFFLTYSNMHTWRTEPFSDGCNYIITAPDVHGPWSDPVYVNGAGIDASLFHDDDGKIYYMSMICDFRRPGMKKFAGIGLGEYDPEEKRLKGEMRNIFAGTERGVTEGPHIYKKDGWYYLITAEGGTGYEHAVTVCRSKDVYGPYEVHPNKILISSLGSDCRLQKAGHGSLCADLQGNWYLAHLCGRPLKDKRCVLGRETAIQNVIWRDGWPYLKDGGVTPRDDFESPLASRKAPERKKIKYSFEDTAFLEDFQTVRMPFSAERFRLAEGKLFIRGKDSIVSALEQSVICRRQTDFSFRATVKLQFSPKYFNHMAGLLYRYDERNQHYLYMSYDEETASNTLYVVSYDRGKFIRPTDKVAIPSNEVYLRVEVNGESGQFYYSMDGKRYVKISATFDATILSDDYANGFTGAFVGMGCQDLYRHEQEAAFSEFVYESLDKE